ncbi:MAG: hypothetical protein ACLS9Q_09605 [[Clostridium] scindens]|jgi:hypothetical protein|uniref:hypothetical protein n=1 Tax=Clostridium scindens (strain JCM 10418 / VPI 12708) TaxID=29347 RepID=UPI003993A52A
MDGIINIKYPNGRMTINLYAFYPTTQKNAKKLVKLIYDNRLENEETYNVMIQKFEEDIEIINRYMKTICENYACTKPGTRLFKQYEKDFRDCQRMLKVDEMSLRILKEGK